MQSIKGKVAWILGAGTGIGQGGAVKLAEAGATVILSGRRREPLDETLMLIEKAGGAAEVEVTDVASVADVEATVDRIVKRHGRIDILVNSAGINMRNRHWSDMTPESWTKIIDVNLNGAFYTAAAVMPLMRAQRDGLIISISSWSGKHVGYVSGVPYTAAKHAMNAMSDSINIENCHYGIRACVICPAEVATPILDLRPMPPPKEERDRMVQMEDMGEAILFVSRMPKHVCINELVISPTWNRAYIGGPDRVIPRDL
jgi:NAD(P)-dependent dehydrogenase (short-subunit alcohol dehydrogenase family)